MTQEDRELLLQDLCARLPYAVKVCYTANHKINGHLVGIVGENVIMFSSGRADFPISDIRPYLRPMSSMTEKERVEYLNACGNEMDNALSSPRYSGIDWLNKNHFDYRGLIPKGLAIAYKSQYIDKTAIIAEINRIKKEECPIDTYEGRMKLFYFEQFLSFLNTLE